MAGRRKPVKTAEKRREGRGRATTGRAAARIRGRSGLVARKQPRQDRSVQMVAAILEAAAAVFASLGYARATTNKIAARAGVSVGSLYQYFPNKDSLLAGLLARHHEDVHRVIGAALARLADLSTPLEDGMRELLENLVALHRENPALTRALSAAVLRESPAADDPHKDDDDDVERVAEILRARPDVREGDAVAMAMVLGQTIAQLTRWLVHDIPTEADSDALLEETLELVVRYLSPEAGP